MIDLPERAIDTYGREQAAIMREAKSKIKEVAALLDWSPSYENLVMNREAMIAVMGDVVSSRGMAAAANAAELFEVLSEAATGRYKAAKMAEGITYDRVSQAVHYAARSLFPEDQSGPDVEGFVSRVCESTVRMVNSQAMDTMAANQSRGIFYKRVVGGDNVCPLCEELASRGYVWDVDELIEPHDGCMCSLVPGFNDGGGGLTGNVYPELDDIF